jgi:hypothetical protein
VARFEKKAEGALKFLSHLRSYLMKLGIRLCIIQSHGKLSDDLCVCFTLEIQAFFGKLAPESLVVGYNAIVNDTESPC